jgi:hypothetical protein
MNETKNMVPLQHEPAHPPRDGTPSEGIYLRAWQAFIRRATELAIAQSDESDDFRAIFHNANRELTQGMATAAASLITWLGTNCGQSFLFTAKRRAEEAPRGWGETTAWLAQWAIENERVIYINHGLRTIEFLMAPIYPIRASGGFGDRVDWKLVPEVTMEQIDAVECVVRWLSTSQGQTFVASCESQIKAAQKDARLFGATA